MTKIEVTLLGDFSIKYGENVISEKDDNSKKRWNLLKYLLVNRERLVPQSELIEQLAIKPTPSALKTQFHRLKKSLEKLQLPVGNELLISYTGGYSFNNSLDCIIDAEVFDRLYNLSRRNANGIGGIGGVGDKTRNLRFCLQAIDVYKGNFLQSNAGEPWVVSVNLRYRSNFLELVHSAIDILYSDNKSAEVVKLCRRALAADEYDQRVHYMLIKSLAESGDKHSAKKHYEYVIELFMNNQVTNLSSEITGLFEELIVTKEEHQADLNVIMKSLAETTPRVGAFFCEYEFFKYIYRLLQRDVERTHKKLHICVVTMQNKNGGVPTASAVKKSDEKLRESIGDSLRRNDIFTRYSVYQYVILLLDSDKETNDKIMERLLLNYNKKHPKSPVILSYSVSENGVENSEEIKEIVIENSD